MDIHHYPLKFSYLIKKDIYVLIIFLLHYVKVK